MESMKHLQASVKRDAHGKMTAVATTESIDREGESIKVGGWNLDNFANNPIMLWAHNHFELPIGKANNVRFQQVNKKRSIVFEPDFHNETDLARAVGKLFQQGILNTFSVGFIPLERDGSTITKAELLEISAVNVPANADAHMLRSVKGLTGAEHRALTDAMSKQVVPYVKTAKAPKTALWLPSKETKGANIDDLRRMGTFVDEQKSDQPEGYHLIHHERNGRVNYRGVLAAIDELNAGEVTIPAADRKAVYDHLAKHLQEDFGEEAPPLVTDGETPTNDIPEVSDESQDAEVEAKQIENEKLKAHIATLERQLADKERELASASKRSMGTARARDLLKAVQVRANKALHELNKE